MNRRTRLIVVLVIAIICATGATFGLVYAIKKMNPPPKPEPQIRVAVATKDIAMGMRLTAEDVKVVNWPAATPVKGAYDDVKKVINRGLLAGVITNEPLTDQKMAPLEAGAGLAIQITEGMRAISVKVNEVIGVAGFVLPGAKVDVLVTIRQREMSVSRVVVSNVQVLSSGTRYDQQQAKDGKPQPTTVVTLMVTPPDAERIALAATEGQLLLTLRYPLDKKPTVTTGINTITMMGSPPNPSPTPARPPTAGAPRKPVAETAAKRVAPVTPVVYEVDAIRGGKRSKEVVR